MGGAGILSIIGKPFACLCGMLVSFAVVQGMKHLTLFCYGYIVWVHVGAAVWHFVVGPEGFVHKPFADRVVGPGGAAHHWHHDEHRWGFASLQSTIGQPFACQAAAGAAGVAGQGFRD